MEVQTTRLLLQNASTFILKKGIKGVLDGQLSILKRRKEETPKISNLFIDIGCETKKRWIKWCSCRMRDHHPDEFMILNDNKFVCRAIDNRMGGFMIAEVARLLHENKVKLPLDLYN
jgi:putative aminopeptidase FrvX